MDDKIKKFLNKFAELERRVRKLAVEDRALREEVERLRHKLAASEEKSGKLEVELEEERALRFQARDRLGGLIKKLEESDLEDVGDVFKAVSGGRGLEL